MDLEYPLGTRLVHRCTGVLMVVVSSQVHAQTCALDAFVANDQSGSVSSMENSQSRQFITALFNGMQPWGTGAGQSRMAIADWDSPGVWLQFNYPVAGIGYTDLLSDVLAYQSAPRALFGGTDPYTALLNAYQSIGQSPVPGRVASPVIVLMTDADCSQVPPGLTALATQVKNAGVYVIVVAVEAASSCPSLAGTNVASPGGYFNALTYASLVNSSVSLVQQMVNAGCNNSYEPSYDLSITIDAFIASGCNTPPPAYTADITITNAGAEDFTGPLVVSFYSGPPTSATSTLLLVQDLGVQTLLPGSTFSTSVASLQFANTTSLYALVNYDGALPGNAPPVPFDLYNETVVADEYATFNNTSPQADRTDDPVTCPPQAILTTDIVSGGVGCNDLVTYEVTICNTGDADAFITPTLPIAAPGALLVNNVIQPGNYTVDLDWATYCGGDDEDEAFSVATDPAGNVYIAGTTRGETGIATPGSHRPNYSDGREAFLVKFNSSGVRQWGTYYGDEDDDYGMAVATDALGNVYLVGYTDSPTSIATAGSHQPALNNNEDAFIVKFNTNGVRQWASYYGGSAADFGFSVATDATNNVYLAGITEGSTTLGTAGAFDNTYNGARDQFLVKFNSSGVRQWATYHGGTLTELEATVTTDAVGNVFLTGQTRSTTGIATAGAAQVALGGLEDAFLAKFSTTGARLWGTYVGGLDSEDQASVACDPEGNVHVCGTTGSENAIAFGTYHQGFRAGGKDGYLMRFNTNGVRQWGTYLGGTDGDEARDVATDAAGDIYVTGSTTSLELISTLLAHGTVLNGIEDDAFIMKFRSNGQRAWGTYYGGTDVEDCYSLALDAQGNMYIAGATLSSSGVATPGAHQTAIDTDEDAFLAKFFEVELPYILGAGDCLVRQYIFDYSGVAPGTYSLSMGLVADKLNVLDETPLVLPDINFNAGSFIGVDGFNGAVHTSDDVTIPVVGTNCAPGNQISLAVNIPTASSCGTGYFATAMVTITNNSGLTVSNTDLFLELTGANATYAGEIYNATAGLSITAPNVLDPLYPGVSYALYSTTGVQVIPIMHIPPGVSTFDVDIAIGTATANLSARIDSIHTGINATGQSNLASDATGIAVFPSPVINNFNCPGSVTVGSNIVFTGIAVSGASTHFWSSTTVASMAGGGTVAAPTLAYTPTPLDVANGFVEISLTAVNASGCETTETCQVLIDGVQYDYGDAPVVYDLNINYLPPAAASTLFSGANLGFTAPGADLFANNSLMADGDGSEEDALTSNPWTDPWPPPGSPYVLPTRATNNSGAATYLHAYVDWNADGDFLDALESSLNTVMIAPLSGSAMHNMQFTVPSFVNTGSLFYIRVRLSVDSLSVTVPYMAAPRGETEDYVWASVGPLPVELISFTGREEGRGVRLQWATASEINSSHFAVERSADASTYSSIGEVQAAGHSQSLITYVLDDPTPFIGWNYYRLAQVDLDGTVDHSHTVAVQFASGSPWVAHHADGHVTVHGLQSGSTISIMDMAGRVLAIDRDANGTIYTDRLPAGLYTLTVLDPTGPSTPLRFVKR
jgi:GEVED domain/Beta-propeller repeat